MASVFNDMILKPLYIIFRHSFITVLIPIDWGKVILVPIFKWIKATTDLLLRNVP